MSTSLTDSVVRFGQSLTSVISVLSASAQAVGMNVGSKFRYLISSRSMDLQRGVSMSGRTEKADIYFDHALTLMTQVGENSSGEAVSTLCSY